jgi:hypothetical protein
MLVKIQFLDCLASRIGQNEGTMRRAGGVARSQERLTLPIE